MIRHPRFVIPILLAAASIFFGPAHQARAQSPDRLVLAFYYTWFDENTWSPAKVSDMPLAPYVSRDREVMARHIEQAKAAGIDALVVSWYGPQEENNQTETNLRAMLDLAQERGFRLAVDFEVTSPFFGDSQDVRAALQTLMATHAQHPAYLRSEGKPVIFFWRQQRYSTDTWAQIRANVDPNHGTLWIEEGVDVAGLTVFDGHHLYKVTWNPPADLTVTAKKFAGRVAAAAERYGTPKIYVATAMPGWDDRKLGRGDSFGRDREGGAYYERSWQAAMSSDPDWIVITSFNEWLEGTHIEPSVAHGSRYLELTAGYAGAFHAASAPAAAQPTPEAVAEATAELPAAEQTPAAEAPEPSVTSAPSRAQGSKPLAAASPARVKNHLMGDIDRPTGRGFMVE